jgi:multicomponent Na+:H+ antiporter subunit G
MSVVAAVLIWVGVGVAVLSAMAALRLPPINPRLHALAPITSLAGPLVGVGLAVANGWSLTTATVLLIVVLLAVTGPVLVAATARLAAERDEERSG